jgi:myo-inositol 2-dehydrogenase / D-chiro-inositol 1-dehydrogenase
MMHLPTLAERPDLFEIAALSDISEEVLHAVGERYHVGRRSRDFREVATDPGIDAVFVLSSGRHDAALHAAFGSTSSWRSPSASAGPRPNRSRARPERPAG